ncbi:hypothetical protein DLH72_04020 [Candidatus Gracilibacteria bacterium]|nr:MAG: hypothetical protein DLH72_04020 [Candidatus Gracilibacteria bacterium]
MEKITKFKIFRNGVKVADGSFGEISELTRKKLEQMNILSVHFSTFESKETRNKFIQLLVMNGIDKEVEDLKNFFNYKIIFEDEADFEKDELEGKKTDEDFLKEKLKDLIDKIF